MPGLVQGYAGPDNPFGGADEMIKDGQFAVNPQFEWTGGGLAVTAEDLARWAKLLYEGKVVDASLMDDLLDGVPARLGPENEVRPRRDHSPDSARRNLRALGLHARVSDRRDVFS